MGRIRYKISTRLAEIEAISQVITICGDDRGTASRCPVAAPAINYANCCRPSVRLNGLRDLMIGAAVLHDHYTCLLLVDQRSGMKPRPIQRLGPTNQRLGDWQANTGMTDDVAVFCAPAGLLSHTGRAAHDIWHTPVNLGNTQWTQQSSVEFKAPAISVKLGSRSLQVPSYSEGSSDIDYVFGLPDAKSIDPIR